MIKKYRIPLLISILLSCTFIYIIYSKSENNSTPNTYIENVPTANITGTRKQQDTIAFGLKDSNRKHIDNGSNLELKNGNLTAYLELEHNINESRKYCLLIFEDYQQTNFKIKNKKVNNFYFDTIPNSTTLLKVQLTPNPDTKDLAFLIIKKPEYMLEKMDLERATVLEDVFSLRFSIDNNLNKNYKDSEPDNIIYDNLNENIFVTKHKKQLQAVIAEKEGTPLLLSSGNDQEEKVKYAIIALQDWEQKKIIKDKKIIYTTVAPESRNLFEFRLPNVAQENNLQIIAFPSPFEVTQDDYLSQKAFGSFRILIQTNKNKEE